MSDLQNVRGKRRQKEGYVLPWLLLGIDYAAVLAAEGLAFVLRRYVVPGGAFFDIPSLFLFVVVPAIFLLFLRSSHRTIRSMPFYQLLQSVCHSAFYAMLIVVLMMYAGHVAGFVSRLFVAMMSVFVVLFVLIGRCAVRSWLSRSKLLQTPVLFIGAGRTAELVVSSLGGQFGFGYRIIGFIDDHPVSEKIAGEYEILGGFDDIERVIRRTRVRMVVVTAPGLAPEKQVELVQRIQPLVESVAFVPDFIGLPVGSLEAESLVDEQLLLLRVRNNLQRPANRAAKRVFDLVCCALGAPLVVPVCLLIALAIKLDSRGPVLFAHRRIGQHGRRFPCWKFRTMVPNAEEVLRDYLAKNPEAQAEWDRDFKLKDDPRVTRVGRFLRKTSLDELPQVWNVVVGEMSLVGPRPIVRAEIPRYGSYFHDFCLVPPGITGMWQVNGRSDTTYDERVAMDSWYVRNWSVWLDVVYLMKTFGAVLQQKGAY